ncbi:MAG TPA: LysM peptidoglycan-binding domain-containing protein [Longimicrobium sp.]|nr:LysM peptidoglycan-binding domain-containing protein [Longimicrobium sp.]
MRRIPLLLLFAATLAAALPAAAQTTPRRPPADTVRFGTTRPAAGDSIAMAEYDEAAATGEDEDAAVSSSAGDEAGEDTVPVRPRPGPYSQASGTGPFSVQASGETVARPPRGDVVWLQGRAARPAASDSSRRDTARAGSGQRVASGASARRDTASAAGSRTRRDTASATATRPARRDSASTATRPAARDTAGARRNGQTAAATGGRTGSAAATSTSGSGRTGSASTTSATTGGRTGATTTTTGGRTGSTATTTGGRTGSASATTSTSGARARTHTVASGETFFAIARRYGVTAAQLRAINPGVDQDALEIGDVLRLPAAARDSRVSSGTSSSTASGSQRTGSQAAPRTGSQGSSAARRSHTVAAGETLFGIARRYGVTVDAIRQANELEGDALRTGQRLVIPPAR